MSLRFAVGVWVAVLLGVFGRVAFSRPDQQSVVPIYLHAAERLKANENLYAPSPPGMDIYRNPPAVAALFVPFTFLDPKPAALLWRLLGISLYLVGVRQLIRDVLPRLSAPRRAWIWMLSAVLVIPSFNNGQINLPIVATALLGTAAAARGERVRAAVWLVACGWFKVYTAAVGLLMSVARPREFFSRFFVAGFLIVGATWLGVEMWGSVGRDWEVRREPLTDFIGAMQADDRSAAAVSRAPKDWTIIARTWFGVVVPQAVSMAVSLLAAVGMAGWVWLQSVRAGSASDGSSPGGTGLRAGAARKEGSPSLALPALILGLIWLTLLGPATEMNTYAVLAPVAAVLSVTGRAKWLARVGTGMLLVAVVRGAFPQEWGWHLPWLQPLGAVFLLCEGSMNVSRGELPPDERR